MLYFILFWIFSKQSPVTTGGDTSNNKQPVEVAVNGGDKEIEFISQKTSKIDISADAKQQEDDVKPVKRSTTPPAPTNLIKSETFDDSAAANTACDNRSNIVENYSNSGDVTTTTIKPIVTSVAGDNQSSNISSVEVENSTAVRPVSPKVNQDEQQQQQQQASPMRNGVVIPDVKIEVVADTPAEKVVAAVASPSATTVITKDGGNKNDNICTDGIIHSKGLYIKQ